MSTSYGLTIVFSRNEKLQKCIIFLSQDLTIYTNDWSTFWHVYLCHVCFFFCKNSNICAIQERDDPPWLAFYGNGLASWPGWLDMVNAGWIGSIRSKIFFQMELINVPSNRLPFYAGSPLHIISSLFIFFCLFQNAILNKMLKLGFWNFRPIFLKMQFSLVATFFSLVLIICLSWYLILTLSHEFLTFILFNIWR